MRYDFLGLCEATGFRERVTWARQGTRACKVTLLQVRLCRDSRPELEFRVSGLGFGEGRFRFFVDGRMFMAKVCNRLLRMTGCEPL